MTLTRKHKKHSVPAAWRRSGRKLTAGLAIAGAASLTLVASAGMGFAGAGTALGAVHATERTGLNRGDLVSVTPLRTLAGQAAVRAELTADGFDAFAARYGVHSYRLVYRTVDAHGRPATASGLLALPAGGPRRLSLVSFTHRAERTPGSGSARSRPSAAPTTSSTRSFRPCWTATWRG
jgi:hypothetical protein